jgi:hypothetical protein
MLWGYSDELYGLFSNTNLGGGGNTINGSTVPSGELWIVENVSMMYLGTSPTYMLVNKVTSGGNIPLLYQSTPTQAVWYTLAARITLNVGERLNMFISGATAGDSAYIRYAGYKMEL